MKQSRQDAAAPGTTEKRKTWPRRINRQFLNEVMSYLSFERYPVDATRAQARDTKIRIQTIHLDWFRYALLVGVPLTMVLIGSVVLMHRRAK